jgi:hypothetical protein
MLLNDGRITFRFPSNVGDNNKLNEHEAVEEIKQLARQLQNLYDRIPQRGATTNVILTLLEICRAAQQQPPSAINALSIKSLDQKVTSVCNGNGVSGENNSGVVEKKICLLDKETNTSFDNLMWQQFNDANCGRKISTKCDLNTKDMFNSRKSKCCATSTINDSTNSINFENLQLQCMCSSENNSEEDFQVDNCDNCSSMQKQSSPCKHHVQTSGSASFRERLLYFTSCNHSKTLDQRANNLLKRNSELVLGTNFEETMTKATCENGSSGGVYKSCQSYRVSCDNIFSNNKIPLANEMMTRHNDGTNKKTKQSTTCVELETTDCNASSSHIPYSFLERPTMKLSQSEDQNLRDLKIALSSTLPAANRCSNSNANAHLQQKQLKNAPPTVVTQTSHSCTSSSSFSSKIDKISFTLSTSSVSDVLTPSQQHQQHQQQQQNYMKDDDMRNMTDETHKEQQEVEARSINNQNDNKNEDNKMIMATSKNVEDNKASEALAASASTSTSTNVNNKHINNGNNKNNTSTGEDVNGGSKKRKTPEGKLAIDLNDRSKYTDEVSV